MEFFAEFLPFINSCNIFVKLKQSAEVQSIEICRNEFTLNLSISSIRFSLCPGITFKPTRLENADVNKNEEWLSFRLQLDEKSRVINTVLSEISYELSNMNLVKSLEESLPNHLIKVLCIHCGLPISSEVSFKRVLPLPSVDWDAASEDWFCHLQSCHKKLLKETSIVLKLNDCFYNDVYFCFNKDILHSKDVNDDKVICSKCHNAIGDVSGDKVKLWSADVKIVGKNNVFHSKTSKDIVLQLLKNLEKDSFGINPRLVLQASNKTQKKYLCLHPIDTSIELLVFSSNDENFICKLNQNSKKTKFDTGLENHSLKRIKAMKILYKFKERDDEESGNWVDDVNFHIIPCGKYFFESVFQSLKMSNEELPCPLKAAGKFNIGYIPVS